MTGVSGAVVRGTHISLYSKVRRRIADVYNLNPYRWILALVCACVGLGAASPALAQSEMGVPPPTMSVSSTGVNLYTGGYGYSHTDLSIGDLDLIRSYTGGELTRSKFFGQRWSHNFDMYVFERITSVNDRHTHFMIGGHAYTYFKDSQNTLTPLVQADSGLSAQFANNKYTLIDRDNILYTFAQVTGNPRGSASWSAESVEFPSGKRLAFLYDGNGRLKAVTSNTGYALVFDYGTSGYVSQACAYNLANTFVNATTACASATHKTTYGYSGATSSALLTSATNVLGQAPQHTQSVTYAPNRAGHVRCVTDFGSSNCPVTNIYDGGATEGTWPQGFVTSQTLSSGGSVQYSYSRMQPGETDAIYPWEPFIDGSTVMTDPSGNQTSVAYDRGRPMTWGNSEGRGASYEYYWLFSSPSKIALPEGNAILFTPSAEVWTEKRLRDKSGNSANDLVSTASYPQTCYASSSKRCNKPDYVIDARGNRTDYTYHAATGNIATETGPAVNGVRPQKRYTYEQRYAGVKNSAGSIVSAATPVWLLIQDSECKTNSSCTSTSDEVRTTYEYGGSGTANALRLRGKVAASGSLNLRTCYGYDNEGNRISETAPRAGLTSCP